MHSKKGQPLLRSMDTTNHQRIQKYHQNIGDKMVIDESADEENDENEEEDELLRMINLTFSHIVQDDKEELVKLIDELNEILTSDTLLELGKAVREFLIKEKRMQTQSFQLSMIH